MRASQYLLSTIKETPSDAEIASHQLMLRAGFIRKLGSGLYTWLPLGLRTLRKVEQIVREEMNRAGALEVLMPAVQPAELWEETGRWETFGGQLLKIEDNSGRAYCFGPTHEEVITDLIRNELHSYKQLPLNLYQIQTKFRDEIRPRFGVMRAREFIMKDAYSFHLEQASLEETYQSMYDTYCRIFDRMGLKYRAVEADTGAIGGAVSHEFQVLADSGEDVIFYSDTSKYAANVEQASALIPAKATSSTPSEPMQMLATPGQKTITDVANFLKIAPEKMVKTLIARGVEHPLVALVLKGDDDLNEIKAAKHALVASPLQFADEASILKQIGAPIGSIGPVKLTIPILVDHHALALSEFTCGANQADQHYMHVSWERDANYQEACDLRTVKVGDKSPDGKGKLEACRGIEVGHVFQLGSKYAEAMNAAVSNESGKAETLLMGCYGLGVTRVVAAAIEQHHDEKGIIWPAAIAPFAWVIIPMNAKRSEQVQTTANTLYETLFNQGIDVLLDDRDERAGVLFADHDLIGIPHRVIIGDRNLAQGLVEYKRRDSAEVRLVSIDEILHLAKVK